MIAAVLTGLLWAAAGWRTVAAVASRRRSSWSLTIALALFATSTSCWVYARQLNAVVAIPNLSYWLARATLGLCWIIIQPLIGVLLSGRPADGASRRTSVVVTVLMIVSTGALWLLAPLHESELATLDAAPDLYTTAFVAVSYAWLISLLTDLSHASIQSIRTHVTTDRPGLVCASFLLITGVLGVIGVTLMTAERLTNVGSHSPGILAQVAGMLMPAAAATAALGVLAIPVLEQWERQKLARQTIAHLGPTWEAVRASRPELIVELPRWRRMLDAPLVAERMRIEILDAGARQAKNSAI